MAAAERPCTNEVLKCKVEDVSDFFNRKLLDSANMAFSGVNEDEPSIEPDHCSIRSVLSDKAGLSFGLSLDDNDYFINIYPEKNENGVSHGLNGDASFYVVPGKPFYYRYGSDLLTCVLSR